MGEIISKITPVFILIFLGFIFKKKGLIKQETMDEMKKLVLDIALPALLFIIFIHMEIKIEVLGLTAVNILFFCLLLVFTYLIKDLKGISSPTLPFLTPGLSFGTMGIPLFIAVFGMEALPTFSVLNIGNELFIWFVLVILLKYHFSGERFSTSVFKDFIRSPFIIAVLSGLILNISGLRDIISQNILYNGLVSTLDLLGTIVSPLILIILGYDLQLNRTYIRESVKILVIRYAAMLLLGGLVKYLILDRFIHSDPLFDYAWFTYLILPPSNSVPLLFSNYSTEENASIATNVVVLSSILCILIYTGFVLII